MDLRLSSSFRLSRPPERVLGWGSQTGDSSNSSPLIDRATRRTTRTGERKTVGEAKRNGTRKLHSFRFLLEIDCWTIVLVELLALYDCFNGQVLRLLEAILILIPLNGSHFYTHLLFTALTITKLLIYPSLDGHDKNA